MAEVVRVKAKNSLVYSKAQSFEAVWAHGKFWARIPKLDHSIGKGEKVWFDYYPEEVEVTGATQLPFEKPVVISVGATIQVNGTTLKKVTRDGIYVEVGAR